ncbi:MAG: DUF1501 domain-containing protein [Planctomycetota bacterium]
MKNSPSNSTIARRSLLQSAAAGIGLYGLSGPAWARAAARALPEPGDSGRILVLLNLDGGNDGLSTVVRREDDTYYRARPTLATPKKDLLPLDDLHGFHPSLLHIAERWKRGQVACIQGIGSPNPNLSHFSSRDSWAAGSVKDVLPQTGWLGRYQELVASQSQKKLNVPLLAVGTDTMPYALRDTNGSAVVVPSLDTYEIKDAPVESRADARRRAMERLHRTSGSAETRALAEAYRTARLSIEDLERVRSAKVRSDYPTTALGVALRTVSQVLAGGLPTRIFHVMQPGYDTHTDQLPTQARLLRDLDSSLHVFMKDLEKQKLLDRTLIMTTSEFGRRVAESGIGSNVGSDHGAGNSLLCFGGEKLRAGFHGEASNLEDLDANGNLHMKLDFRQMYADAIGPWLGSEPKAVLGGDFAPIGITA